MLHQKDNLFYKVKMYSTHLVIGWTYMIRTVSLSLNALQMSQLKLIATLTVATCSAL